jgi:1-phosphofructokinase
MEPAASPPCEVLTITLNPAIDQTVQIPGFAAGKVNRVAHVQQNPGGKGVNVAVTLADAGHHVAVTGFLGRENSASFEDLFAHKAIADQFVRLAGSTRIGVKIIDPEAQETTDINYPGLAPTPGDLDELRERVATTGARWAVLSGSLPPGVAPTIYRELTAALRERGCQVALDTSGEPLRHTLEAAPQIIKPNIHELEATLGVQLPDSAAVVAAARQLLARGIGLVVVSMGEQGALLISPSAVVRARPPAVTVQSTVGAGDAMVAGIVAAQLRGLPLAEAARLATAFSVDAISRIGAGLSAPSALDAIMARVEVEELSAQSS